MEETTRCECGELLGERCEHEDGPRVVLAYVPRSDQQSCLAACGASHDHSAWEARVAVHPQCADLLLADADYWMARETW